jgi:ABC-type spermidine/putrescine transport system permease subunit II
MRTEARLPFGYVVLRVLIAIFAWMVLVYLILPQFVVIPLSFSDRSFLSFPPTGWSVRWYQSINENPAWSLALTNSLLIAVPTAILSMVLGTLAALAVSRGQIAYSSAISAMIVAPMMLPHVILAIGLYPVMLSLGLLSSYTGAIIGHTVVGAPLAFITVSATLGRYSAALELAAMTLGANPWQTFWQVTFPMIRTGVIVGGILAFATSFDELMLSLFLTGPGTRTLPRLIWEQMNDYLTPTIAAVATLIFVFTLVLLFVVAILQMRSPGKVSRIG